MSNFFTLKPGLLVSLRTSLRGGVQYTRVDIEKATDGSAEREKWETTKVVSNLEEHERATKVRGKVGALIRAVCVPSAFGYICPIDREADLDKAIEKAKELARAHSATSPCRVEVYTLKGRIAQTDDEAARAISGELRELLDEMGSSIAAGKVTEAREAASKAKKMGAMLSDETAEKVGKAIEEVREVAREIVKKLSDGADAAEAVRDVQLKALDAARFAFLDLDVPLLPAGDTAALPSATARGLDLDGDETPAVASEPTVDV